MPTLKDLKATSSKKSLQNINADPAKNSVMGNVKLLYDNLVELQKQDEFKNRFEVTSLKNYLGSLVGAFEGKYSEEDANMALRNAHAELSSFYSSTTGVKKIKNEEERKKMSNLVEYVAVGLDADSFLNNKDIHTTEEQKSNVAKMKEQGAKEVAEETLDEEYASKKAVNFLDEYKADVLKEPKSFSGSKIRRDAEEAASRFRIMGKAYDILATRRAIEATRNNKAGLEKATVNRTLKDNIRKEMIKNKALEEFMMNMPYKDLRSLVSSGHGGALEDKFAEHLKKGIDHIPADTPAYYMPTAKERIEGLKAKMDNFRFQKQTSAGEQRDLYIELMATRAAVNSKRGDKSSLSPTVDPKILEEKREMLKKEPLKTALIRATLENTPAKEAAYKAAMDGHGGALEDLVRKEVRNMACEKESGYKMQDVDERYAPTYDDRRNDLKAMIKSATLSDNEKFRAVVELGKLDAAQNETHRKGDEVISNIGFVNRTTDAEVAFYSKLMGDADKLEFVNNATQKGYDEACKAFDAKHPGEVKAARFADKLEDELNKMKDLQKRAENDKTKMLDGPNLDDLKKLAAQKMALETHKAEFRDGKITSEQLEKALEPDALNKNVNTLLTRDHIFSEVCNKLGVKGLLAQAGGDGKDLAKSYQLAREDKLEFYNAPKPAVAKVQKNGPEAGGGPQL